MTQADRVLALSRRYNGVCQAELLGGDIADDGKPITRLAARIQDLEARGHVFELVGWRKSCRVYRWADGPEVERAGGKPQSSEAAPVPVTGSLSAPVELESERLFEVGQGQHGFADQEQAA